MNAIIPMRPARGFSAMRAVWVLAALGAAALAAWLWAANSRPPSVSLSVASRRDVVRTVIAAGRVTHPARVRVGSAVLGAALDVAASEGARVKFGDLLVRLEDSEALAAVDGARAVVLQAETGMQSLREVIMPAAGEEVREADAALTRASDEFERVENLVREKAATRRMLDEARAALDVERSRQARAMLKAASMAKCGPEHKRAVAAMIAAQAALDAACARAALFTIRAPSDAIVLRRMVEPGDLVQPGKVLMELGAGGGLEIVVPVDEKNLSGIVRGLDASAQADGFPGTRFAAIVTSVAPVADPARGTVDVRMRIPKAPEFLVDDMTVTVEMRVERKKDAVVVPFGALRDAAATRPWVLVHEDGKARKRDIRLGLRGDGFVEILDGLAEGDRVILPGNRLLRDGDAVRAHGGAEQDR